MINTSVRINLLGIVASYMAPGERRRSALASAPLLVPPRPAATGRRFRSGGFIWEDGEA